MRVRLKVRRLFCRRPSCARRTFVEQVDGLTIRYGRHSVLLRKALETIALMLAGRAGARLAHQLAVPVRRMTLLRLIRRQGRPAATVTPTWPRARHARQMKRVGYPANTRPQRTTRHRPPHSQQPVPRRRFEPAARFELHPHEPLIGVCHSLPGLSLIAARALAGL